MIRDTESSHIDRVSWLSVFAKISLGLGLYILVSWWINPDVGVALNRINRVAGDAMLFSLLMIPSSIVAIIIGRLIPAYRVIPISNLVNRAFWISAVFLSLMLLGGWYGGQKDPAVESSVNRETEGSADPDKSDAENFEDARAALARHGLDKIVWAQVAELQKNLPIRNDLIEEVVGINYLRSTKTQTWRHQLAHNWEEVAAKTLGVTKSVVVTSLPASTQERTVNSACTVQFTRLLLANGLIIRHDYYEQDGSLVFSTKVKASDCR